MIFVVLFAVYDSGFLSSFLQEWKFHSGKSNFLCMLVLTIIIKLLFWIKFKIIYSCKFLVVTSIVRPTKLYASFYKKRIWFLTILFLWAKSSGLFDNWISHITIEYMNYQVPIFFQWLLILKISSRRVFMENCENYLIHPLLQSPSTSINGVMNAVFRE